MNLWDDDDSTDTFDLGINKALTDTSDTSINHQRQLNAHPLDQLAGIDLVKGESRILQQLKDANLMSGLVDTSGARLRPEDKRIIGGTSDVNQLIPFKYQWAWDKWLAGCANNWTPGEVPMTTDIAQWQSKDKLTSDERWVIENSLGFFSTADTVVANNVVLGIYGRLTAPECRQYLLRQSFEEGLHTWAYQYCIQSLGMDEGKIFNLYRENPSMTMKNNWCMQYEAGLTNPDSTDQDFLRNLIAYYMVMEGMFFYCGFSQVFSMGRRGKMPGVCEQFQYILRDESLHVNFGVDVINQIKIENPHLWTKQFQEEVTDMIMQGTMLEISYAKDTMPNGLLGMNHKMMSQYLRFIATRRLESIGLPQVYGTIQTPFPWMSEMLDIRKEKNFFESRVTEYNANGLDFNQ